MKTSLESAVIAGDAGAGGRPTVGSLFAGIGGMDLGLERAGFEVRWQVEISEFCRRVLSKHWPKVRRYGDIRGVGSELDPVDLVAGGFPCQDVSSAGGRAGIVNGSRSGLWSEMLRVLQLLRPRVALLENVSALLDRMDGGRAPAPIQRVLGDLAESGFDAEWDCLPTGLNRGHRRDRVFIVAYPMRSGLSGSGECREAANQAKCLYGDSTAPGFLRAQSAPAVVRNVLGIPGRMDRIVGIGNCVAPDAAEWIGRRILAALSDSQRPAGRTK